MNNQELLKRFADHYGLTVENAKDAGYGDISPLLPFFLLDAGAADVVTELRHHSLRHQMKRHARLLQDAYCDCMDFLFRAYDQDGTDEVIARMDSMGAAVHNDYTIARLSVMRALRMDCDSDQAVLAASVVMMATVTWMATVVAEKVYTGGVLTGLKSALHCLQYHCREFGNAMMKQMNVLNGVLTDTAVKEIDSAVLVLEKKIVQWLIVQRDEQTEEC